MMIIITICIPSQTCGVFLEKLERGVRGGNRSQRQRKDVTPCQKEKDVTHFISNPICLAKINYKIAVCIYVYICIWLKNENVYD